MELSTLVGKIKTRTADGTHSEAFASEHNFLTFQPGAQSIRPNDQIAFPSTPRAQILNSERVQMLLRIESRYFTWLHWRLQNAPVRFMASTPTTAAELTEALAIDCEGVGVGPKSRVSIAARVSVVNERCEVVYDSFVKPPHQVTDYRTWITGIRRQDLENGRDLDDVINDVKRIVDGRKLVGHALHNDFKMLKFSHPEHLIRDTANYDVFKCMARQCHPSLKTLAKLMLDIKIQDGIHDSVVDARTAMQLYVKHKAVWEASEYDWPELPGTKK